MAFWSISIIEREMGRNDGNWFKHNQFLAEGMRVKK